MTRPDRKHSLIVLDPKDSVAVTTATLSPGEIVVGPDGSEYEVLTRVRRAHKLALRDHAKGEPVIKYGAPIGVASVLIRRAEHVHTHNLVTVRGRRDVTAASSGSD